MLFTKLLENLFSNASKKKKRSSDLKTGSRVCQALVFTVTQETDFITVELQLQLQICLWLMFTVRRVLGHPVLFQMSADKKRTARK